MKLRFCFFINKTVKAHNCSKNINWQHILHDLQCKNSVSCIEFLSPPTKCTAWAAQITICVHIVQNQQMTYFMLPGSAVQTFRWEKSWKSYQRSSASASLPVHPFIVCVISPLFKFPLIALTRAKKTFQFRKSHNYLQGQHQTFSILESFSRADPPCHSQILPYKKYSEIQ